MHDALQHFKTRATKEELAGLVKATGTKAFYLLYHLGKHRPFTLAKAETIEQYTTDLANHNGGRTPVIPRTDLCETCRKCPHARQNAEANGQ